MGGSIGPSSRTKQPTTAPSSTSSVPKALIRPPTASGVRSGGTCSASGTPSSAFSTPRASNRRTTQRSGAERSGAGTPRRRPVAQVQSGIANGSRLHLRGTGPHRHRQLPKTGAQRPALHGGHPTGAQGWNTHPQPPPRYIVAPERRQMGLNRYGAGRGGALAHAGGGILSPPTKRIDCRFGRMAETRVEA